MVPSISIKVFYIIAKSIVLHCLWNNNKHCDSESGFEGQMCLVFVLFFYKIQSNKFRDNVEAYREIIIAKLIYMPMNLSILLLE